MCVCVSERVVLNRVKWSAPWTHRTGSRRVISGESFLRPGGGCRANRGSPPTATSPRVLFPPPRPPREKRALSCCAFLCRYVVAPCCRPEVGLWNRTNYSTENDFLCRSRLKITSGCSTKRELESRFGGIGGRKPVPPISSSVTIRFGQALVLVPGTLNHVFGGNCLGWKPSPHLVLGVNQWNVFGGTKRRRKLVFIWLFI